MRLVHERDGVIEVRWTWLPFWLATNPKLKEDLERELRDYGLINGITNSDSDLDVLHDFIVKRLQQHFPFTGLSTFLDSLRHVETADSA